MAIDRNHEPAESFHTAILSRLFWAIKRYASVIIACFLFGLLLSYLFLTFVPPKYKASAQLLFDPSMEQLVNSEPGFLPGIASAKALERAIALILSPAILKQVASKLIAHQAPEPSDSVGRTAIQRILSSSTANDDVRLRRLIALLQKKLSVTTEAADQIIIVSYQSSSPQEAAALANLIASTFVEDRLAARKAILSQATGWLDQRASEAKSKLMEIDKRIQDYKAEHKIEGDAGSSEYDGELAHLREQLAHVQDEVSNAESAYNATRSYSEGGRVNYRKLAETLNDPAIEKLRSALTEVESQAAAARSKFGSFHPDVKSKEVQAQVIGREIEAAARRKVEAASKDLEALRYEQRDLAAKVEALRSKVSGLREAEVQLREFQREREAVKVLYDSMLARLTQAAPRQALSYSEFKVLLDAAVPERPKIPPILIWLAGGVFGIGLGIVLVFLLDFFNDRIVHLDDIEEILTIPVLARVPVISEGDVTGGGAHPEDHVSSYRRYAKQYPQSLFTNCLLSAKIILSGDGSGDSSVIMITSPTQGDGKTHLSSNLASLSALLGEKTLLIDLDSRKQSEHADQANGMAAPGISEFLDAANLSGLLTAARDEAGFDIIRPTNAEGMAWLKFHTPQMRELLDFARATYKQVWIDTPPVQMFADALALARKVDGVIIVAEWSKTTRRQVLKTRNLIVQSGGAVLGVIINKVKVDVLISPAMANYQSYYKSGPKPKPKRFGRFL